jgi:hypothetical protein
MVMGAYVFWNSYDIATDGIGFRLSKLEPDKKVKLAAAKPSVIFRASRSGTLPLGA